jgi:hypothetical protein
MEVGYIVLHVYSYSAPWADDQPYMHVSANSREATRFMSVKTIDLRDHSHKADVALNRVL